MIIDTHFHAFPGKFLELMPEAKNDVRGVGFHAFDHQEYLNVMDKYGIDMGVLSNTGGRIDSGTLCASAAPATPAASRIGSASRARIAMSIAPRGPQVRGRRRLRSS